MINRFNPEIFEKERFFEEDVFHLNNYPLLTESNIKSDSIRKSESYNFNLTLLAPNLKDEIKCYIQYCLHQEIKVSLFDNYLRPLQNLISFIENRKENIESFLDWNEEDEERYYSFLIKKGYQVSKQNYKNINLSISEKLVRFTIILKNKGEIYDLDTWHTSKLSFNSSRQKESKPVLLLKFNDIKNQNNKMYIKLYIRYLLDITDHSMSSIRAGLLNLKAFNNHVQNKNYADLKVADVEKYIKMLEASQLSDRTYDSCLYKVIQFMDYLKLKGYIKENLFEKSYLKKPAHKHVLKIVESNVLNQIFNILDECEVQLSNMFLVLYSTGMRCGEMLELRTKSLISNESGYYLKYYQSKMKKDVINPIPKSLYDLLSVQIEKALKHSKNKNLLLFPSKRGTFCSETYFKKKMNKFFDFHNITNNDGTRYTFKPHDYRHNLATTMIYNDVPISVVQKILHHQSLDMTLHYIDFTDERKIAKHRDFINIKGNAVKLPLDDSFTIDNLAKVEWLKKSISAQMLPNGMCGMPIALGKCPHSNSCLTCSDFRTTVEFLPVHENHHHKVCEMIHFANDKGWDKQVEINTEVKTNLEKIIATLSIERGISK